MRLIAWNCNMALHRKIDALLSLKPDLAIVSECASPETLEGRGSTHWMEAEPVWIGQNPHKGLAVFAFNGYAACLHHPYHPTLRYIAPIHVHGPFELNVLAVWAQNASAGITRKHQSGPLRRALTKYREFLLEKVALVAGDLNSNTIWDKPSWRNNHMKKVEILEQMDLVSAYHELRGERHGEESIPTHYWRDRRKDGPTYHIDYAFVPRRWLSRIKEFQIGTFEDWCGNGLSDHVPIVIDVDL